MGSKNLENPNADVLHMDFIMILKLNLLFHVTRPPGFKDHQIRLPKHAVTAPIFETICRTKSLSHRRLGGGTDSRASLICKTRKFVYWKVCRFTSVRLPVGMRWLFLRCLLLVPVLCSRSAAYPRSIQFIYLYGERLSRAPKTCGIGYLSMCKIINYLRRQWGTERAGPTTVPRLIYTLSNNSVVPSTLQAL